MVVVGGCGVGTVITGGLGPRGGGTCRTDSDDEDEAVLLEAEGDSVMM